MFNSGDSSVSKPDPELLTNEQLAAEIEEGMTQLVRSLFSFEAYARVLAVRKNGGPIPEDLHRRISDLRLVREGKLSIEAIAAFDSEPILLEAIGSLPLDVQRKIASTKTLNVVRWNGNGLEVQEASVFSLSPSEIVKVFGGLSILQGPMVSNAIFSRGDLGSETCDDPPSPAGE